MSWTAPMTFVANNVLTAAQLNTHLRDNLLETAPAKATSSGSLFVGVAPNRIEERISKTARVDSSEATSSTSYTDLSTVGPQVTCTTGTRAIIFLHCAVANDTADSQVNMSFAIAGDTTASAEDSRGLQMDGLDANKTARLGVVDVREDLTPGTNQFTAKYKVSAGTGTFSDRFISVIPF